MKDKLKKKMKINIRKILSAQVEDDFDTIEYFQRMQFYCLEVGIFYSVYKGATHFLLGILLMILIYLLYQMYNKTLQNLYYTFWAFTFFIALTIIVNFFGDLFFSNPLFINYFHIFALGIILYQSYLLLSPVYFPTVKWWEYDFRYRKDLKIHYSIFNNCDTTSVETIREGRLANVTRQAASLVSFHDLKFFETITIDIQEKDLKFSLVGRVMSMRVHTMGRGKLYGIRFLLENPRQKHDYAKLALHWRREQKRVEKSKFVEAANHQ